MSYSVYFPTRLRSTVFLCIFPSPVRNIHYRGCFKLPKSTIDKLAIDSSQPNLTAQSCIGACTDKVWNGWCAYCTQLQTLQAFFMSCRPHVFLKAAFAENVMFISHLKERRWSLPPSVYCVMFLTSLKHQPHILPLTIVVFYFCSVEENKVPSSVFSLNQADAKFWGRRKGLLGGRKKRAVTSRWNPRRAFSHVFCRSSHWLCSGNPIVSAHGRLLSSAWTSSLTTTSVQGTTRAQPTSRSRLSTTTSRCTTLLCSVRQSCSVTHLSLMDFASEMRFCTASHASNWPWNNNSETQRLLSQMLKFKAKMDLFAGFMSGLSVCDFQ